MAEALLKGRIKNMSSSAIVNGQLIQMGWDYIQGNGSSSFYTKAITFPVAYSSPPIVIPGKLGDIVGSNPVNISDLASASGSYAGADTVTAAGFNAGVFARNATNIPSTVRSGFSWIAIGQP